MTKSLEQSCLGSLEECRWSDLYCYLSARWRPQAFDMFRHDSFLFFGLILNIFSRSQSGAALLTKAAADCRLEDGFRENQEFQHYCPY
jgi:hypothetical protein